MIQNSVDAVLITDQQSIETAEATETEQKQQNMSSPKELIIIKFKKNQLIKFFNGPSQQSRALFISIKIEGWLINACIWAVLTEQFPNNFSMQIAGNAEQ